MMIKVTAEERGAIHRRAIREGLTASAMARRMLLGLGGTPTPTA
jgi:hypothetical protein